MASIFPGFEYDIFISYRHHDNLDGWVTDFVQNLEKELRGTLKDSITIYFDQNPHDGLLETHNVDKSLEGKLKCLIFIPILSQTYCDPKSFAWQNEFCAFNKLSIEDQFGRDIKLSNGNVASRILPIKIHELDTEDKATIESEIGGVLRAIEFTYKESGVNRPLLSSDGLDKNLNKTIYRNQVNKVANAVKEVINALRRPVPQKPATTYYQPAASAPKSKTRFIVGGAIFILLIVTGYLVFVKQSPLSTFETIDKSVAVLAFADMSPEKDQEWFSDGITEEILNSLANLHELKVTARTSSFYFKGKDVQLGEIARKLGVAHIVEGSVRKTRNRLRITAQLIRASDGFHIWSQTYDRSSEDIFQVQTEIAESIARTLLNELTPERKSKLAVSKPASVEAYEYYLRGIKIHFDKFFTSGGEEYFKESERYLLKAISLDPAYADAYGALADLYDTRSNFTMKKEKCFAMRDSLAQIGYRLNPNSIQTLIALFWSQMKNETPSQDSAFYYLRKAYRVDNEDFIVNRALGTFYFMIRMKESSEKFNNRSLTKDPLDLQTLSILYQLYFEFGDDGLAVKCANKILELDSNNLLVPYQRILMHTFDKKIDEAIKELKILRELRPRFSGLSMFESYILAAQGKKDEALKKNRDINVYMLLGMKREFLTELDKQSIGSYAPEQLKMIRYDFVRNITAFKDFEERVKVDYQRRLLKYRTLE